jgi:hypothetical protein
LTLESLELTKQARDCFKAAAEEFQNLGKHESAAIARERLNETIDS